MSRRVLVTRALRQAGRLCAGLSALGFDPVEVPVLEICPLEDYAQLDAAIGRMEQFDWLIVTSANAVDALVERAAFLKKDLARLENVQIAAIGSATAAAVKNTGLNVVYMPESYVAESLADGMLKRLNGGERILIVRAAAARDVIPDALRSAGADVHVVEAYRNALPKDAPAKLRQAMVGGIDAVTFTSSSSVNYLAEATRQADVEWPLKNAAAVSIGPVTSETLRAVGWMPAAEAKPSDIDGLIAAVVKVLEN